MIFLSGGFSVLGAFNSKGFDSGGFSIPGVFNLGAGPGCARGGAASEAMVAMGFVMDATYSAHIFRR